MFSFFSIFYIHLLELWLIAIHMHALCFFLTFPEEDYENEQCSYSCHTFASVNVNHCAAVSNRRITKDVRTLPVQCKKIDIFLFVNLLWMFLERVLATKWSEFMHFRSYIIVLRITKDRKLKYHKYLDKYNYSCWYLYIVPESVDTSNAWYCNVNVDVLGFHNTRHPLLRCVQHIRIQSKLTA